MDIFYPLYMSLNICALPQYSVIIRTLTGGEKYFNLLKSIESQTIKPAHVYIVQPFGYAPPKEQIGFEEYIHTEKGMWSQRIFGMEYCYEQSNHSKYLLACDDDITFDREFAERMLGIAEEYNADFLIPIKDYFAPLRKRILSSLLGGRTENKHSPYKITIKSNTSFSVNNHLQLNVNPTQSGPFQLFLMRTDCTSEMKLRDEMWLDETRYAWPDDQVFFYKAFLKGFKVLSCKKPLFFHHDGKAGVTAIERENDKLKSIFRNKIIFWRKFIVPQYENSIVKFLVTIEFCIHLLVNGLFLSTLHLKTGNFKSISIICRSIIEGCKYHINS